jgi:hypothetical protein
VEKSLFSFDLDKREEPFQGYNYEENRTLAPRVLLRTSTSLHVTFGPLKTENRPLALASYKLDYAFCPRGRD